MTTETIEWKPIETAPKDRKLMLSKPGAYGCKVGQFREWSTVKYWVVPSLELLLGIHWMRANQPTHWAELPRGPR